MNHALYIAATGMQAQQLNVDTIANNLSNIGTAGYKASQVNFQDLMVADPSVPAGSQGTGVAAGMALRDFRAGEIKPTESQYDIAIRGDGFIEVVLADGSHAYTRGGSLKVGRNGQLTTAGGHELSRTVQLPDGTTEMLIAADGRVSARAAGGDARDVGAIELVGFPDPASLRPLGDGLYAATELSGDAVRGQPGEDGLGTIAHKHLEASNVNMVDEMVNLMLAQRAYQLNAKMVETADELMAMTNNLRRS